jgi:UDP-glucuronate decarboxylase
MLKEQLHPIIFEDIDAITSSDIEWEKFKDKTILISGANGFLAAYLVYVFLYINEKYKTNCKIKGVVRNLKKTETILK